jgi:flagellar protein FliJ
MEASEHFVRSRPIGVRQIEGKLSRMESMIRELSAEVAKLNSAIASEEKKSGVSDPNHFAYPCYAKSVMLRRNNLLRTIENLRGCAMLQKLAA